MTIGTAIAFSSLMALVGWVAWLKMGWPPLPEYKKKD